MEEQTYAFYAIIDSDDIKTAKWWRTRTRNSKKSAGWVKSFKDAKIWLNLSQAKSKATRLGAHARIVEFVANQIVVSDQRERLTALEEEKRLKAAAALAKKYEQDLKAAQEALEAAQKRFSDLKSR